MRNLLVVALAASLAAAASADVLLTNGPWITGIGNGFGGADTSAIETGYTSYGFNINHALVPNAFMIADDFTVPAGEVWDLSFAQWYAYQTGSSTTSTITSAKVVIWSGNPMSGGTPIAGDETTERLLTTYWSGVYRVSTNPLDTNRPVMENLIDLSFVPDLGPGTYWIAVGLNGSLTSGPWSNPVVPARPTDNAIQRSSGTWAVIDGNGTLAGVPPQDMPFILNGTIIPEPATLALGLLALLVRRR